LYTGFDVFVIYSSYNTSLKMATKGGQNMEVYISPAVNSQNFICTRCFYSHVGTSVHGHEIFKIW